MQESKQFMISDFILKKDNIMQDHSENKEDYSVIVETEQIHVLGSNCAQKPQEPNLQDSLFFFFA